MPGRGRGITSDKTGTKLSVVGNALLKEGWSDQVDDFENQISDSNPDTGEMKQTTGSIVINRTKAPRNSRQE